MSFMKRMATSFVTRETEDPSEKPWPVSHSRNTPTNERYERIEFGRISFALTFR